MKRPIKFLSVIIALIILTATACLTVFATQKSQDGLEVQIVTDKDSYTANEDIKTSITVKNTNDYEISNLTVKANLPENLKLIDGDTTKSQEILKSDETFVLEFTSKLNSQIKETSTNPPATQKPNSVATNDVVNNNDNSNDDSTVIKTGENSIYAIIFGCLFLITALIISVVVFMNKNKPNKKKFINTISFVLCLTVIGSSVIGLNVFTAKATETNNFTSSVEISKTVKIDNQDYKISATILFNGKEQETTTPTEPETNEKLNFVLNKDLLKLDSDEYYIEIGKSKDVLFELTVTESISNQTIELMGDNDVIGKLNDDGLNGDKIAGDNIYSAKFNLYSATPKSIEYYAVLDKYKSNSIDMTYYKQLTDEDYELTVDIGNNIHFIENKYEKNVDGSINEKSAQKVYNELINYFDSLKNQGIINDYSEYMGMFELYLSNGTTYGYTFDLSDEERLSKSDREKYDTNINFSVASLEPYANELKAYAFDKSAKSISEFNFTEFYNVDNEDVNVDFMLHLNDYNTIIINTHGNFDGKESVIWIGEQGTEKEFKSYSAILGKNGGLVLHDDGDFGITKNFFKKQYKEGDFNDTLIYIGSCYGANDSLLADNIGLVETLIEKGVDCVFAYNSSVYLGYDNKMCETIISSMLGKSDNTLNTASEALKNAQDKHGKTDPTYTKWWDYLFGIYHLANNPNWAGYNNNPAELLLFGNQDYTLFHNLGCVVGQCIDVEEGMNIFTNINVYRIRNDESRELYYSDSNYGKSNINLILPPDRYVLEIIPTNSIYENKEILLNVKSDEIINLDDIYISKKQIESDFIYKIENNEVIITGYKGKGGDILIPFYIEDKPVVKIDEKSFYKNNTITSVTFENSIDTIGDSAFDSCTSLTTVKIKGSVIDIKLQANFSTIFS